MKLFSSSLSAAWLADLLRFQGQLSKKKKKKNLHTLMVEEKSGHTSAKTFNNLLFDTGGWEIDDLSFIKV